MMFKLKHRLPAMVVGMAASLVFGAENAAAEIDARFADEASFRTYFSGLTTQYDKDWALARSLRKSRWTAGLPSIRPWSR